MWFFYDYLLGSNPICSSAYIYRMQMKKMPNIRLYCEEFMGSQMNESIVAFIVDLCIYLFINSLVYNMSELYKMQS